MKKLNILMVLALILMLTPMISSADQEEKGSDDNIPEPTLYQEQNQEMNQGEDEQNRGKNEEKNNEEDEDCEEGTDCIKEVFEYCEADSDCDDNEKCLDNLCEGVDEDDDSDDSGKGSERRSRVANAVQEMLRVASSTQTTIGEQIRLVAQEQKEAHEEIEAVFGEVSKRGGFARFFIGPDYSKIKDAEKLTEKYNERLQKMGEVFAEVTAQDLVDALNAQIQEMTQVKTELEAEIQAQKGGFSLFGWLNNLLSR